MVGIIDFDVVWEVDVANSLVLPYIPVNEDVVISSLVDSVYS